MTFSQDQATDVGYHIYPRDKILIVGSKNGVDTKITYSASDLIAFPEDVLGINLSTSGFNKASFYIPKTSLSNIETYSKVKVYYDAGQDGIGHNVDIKGEAVVNNTINTDIITDFVAGTDKIQILGAAANEIEWVQSSADTNDTIVRVKSSGNELFILDQVDFNTISASDFIFDGTSGGGGGGGGTPATDSLTAAFDDTAKTITLSGLDGDVSSSDLSIEIFDGEKASTDTNYSFTLSPAQVDISGGNAVITYNNLNKAIQTLAGANSSVNFSDYESIKFGYTKNGGTIENDGLGTSVIDKDVFEILGYTVTPNGSNVSVTLSSELGWDYSASDQDAASIIFDYDYTKLSYVDSTLEGAMSMANALITISLNGSEFSGINKNNFKFYGVPTDGGAEQELTFNTNTISGSFQNGFSVGLEAITNGGNDLATLSAIKVYVDMDGTFDPATDPFGTYHLASGNSPDTQGKVIVGGVLLTT